MFRSFGHHQGAVCSLLGGHLTVSGALLTTLNLHNTTCCHIAKLL